MTARTFVIGVGMTKFVKPGSDWTYPEMGVEAGQAAIADAGIAYDVVGRAFTSYVNGDSCYGQRVMYDLGMTGIPVMNVHNNCASGSSALYLANEAVRYGSTEVAMAVGFEKMSMGAIPNMWKDRESANRRAVFAMWERRGRGSKGPVAAQTFANVGREYHEKYGISWETIAKISVKNRAHATNNPRSQFQQAATLEEVLAAPMVEDPLTRMQCCPTSDGGAAAIVASERFVDEHDLWDRAIEIAGQSVRTDGPNMMDGTDRGIAGFYMGQEAAVEAYEQAQVAPSDLDVIELHDCFAPAELMAYSALGLCEDGDVGKLVENGDTTYGGSVVVNPSGGLLSKGHPLGATGLAQCAELTWQLRGTAEKRQVEGATVGLAHNVGLGGAAVVTVFRKVGK
ncbi:thiolase C-terminal domain-containing protein [Amycolatopsis jejuensis]|uniref:thiolase C-terminal domain-containing protein n=1 Tax=Amycolatopsis jejuensis TaxID=330084 RepID=UPI000525CB0E|nr:beta-ketoacyl synthase N-terminal-like domain-containing protein [Amycolatopsis jejuensis]